jgi:hypothetical protein
MTYLDDDDFDPDYDKYPQSGETLSGDELIEIVESDNFSLRILELVITGRLSFEAGFEEIPNFWNRLIKACMLHPELREEHMWDIYMLMRVNKVDEEYFDFILNSGSPESIIVNFDHYLSFYIHFEDGRKIAKLEQIALWILLRDLDYSYVHPTEQLSLIREIINIGVLQDDLVADLKAKSAELLLMSDWDI